MRLSLRFILPLAMVLTLIAYALVPLVDNLTLRWFVRDLEIRSQLVTNATQDSLAPLIQNGSKERIAALFNRMILDDRLFALGLCDPSGKLVHKTKTFPAEVMCTTPSSSRLLTLPNGPLHLAFHPIQSPALEGDSSTGPQIAPIGTLIVVHDMSFAHRRSQETKKYVFYLFIALGAIISAVTVLIAQLVWRGWVTNLRSLISGESLIKPNFPSGTSPELKPIVKDLRTLIQDLESDRKLRDETQMSWTPKALKDILQRELAGDEILIVSNREPYIHNHKDGKIEVQVPASGLVTALEPIMRACSGTWIAHGSGNADRDVVDKHDRVRVPPKNPSYQIRRVWLSKEEEEGYYYGFSNEGLWPLCHIAHTRPVFRSEDFKQYYAVNQKFAKAVIAEAKTDNPVVLVQDYHLALLPKFVKQALPNATIITFWHIPWPNPEAFGICPWREELLSGLLGSSIIGFHTRFHCNNFIDTVDRFLEARINREHSTITHGGKTTAINHYPISIEWPGGTDVPQPSEFSEIRARIRSLNGLPGDRLLGIGVDRLDYTKGIMERFLAVERLLELQPKWQGKFTLLQIAAPTRSSIEQYQHFETEVRNLARRINQKFSRDGYEPICLKVEHHNPDQVFQYFRASDVCLVTSLHDGMNLVAKEFIASRNDERGVLILSQFTGASRELPESLIVNPYNIDQCAAALHLALEMPLTEQRDRMRSMRGLIQEFNVFRWAGKMLMDAARMRQRNRFEGKTWESLITNELSFRL